MTDETKYPPAMQATPYLSLIEQITDPRVAKNEREWAASREIDRLRAENVALLNFARAMFHLSGWPEGGDIDGFDFQDAAEECGLLIPETRTEPCGEVCHCEEYHGIMDMTEGVTCYRKSELLTRADALLAGEREGEKG